VSDFDVLVVDDDAPTRHGLRDLLTGAGFSVDAACDGAEALQKIGRHTFGVVLLDIRLPDVGGLDVLARCMSTPSPPKVVVITGVDPADTALSALRGQAYDFLSKPIDPPRLLEIITRSLSSGRVAAIEVVSARPEWVELLVPCTRDAVDRIHSFVQQLEADLAEDIRDAVGLAFRELLLNGIEWGGRLNPAQEVRVACIRTPRMLLYRIADPGPGFSFEHLVHAAVGHASGDIAHARVREEQGLRPGGFGLVLIRAIADDLVYNERRNEVVFVKYLDESHGAAKPFNP